ncbi:MAG: class II fructose-bisphosphate aldolase [Bacillota bacterium]|nr:class II fructose-bisphosphate aldolase [Bacillota bacterium]
MIISERSEVEAVYRYASKKGWVLPCFCSENLTTTEAVLSAAGDYAKANNIERMPVVLAITCAYAHRSQASYYTNTGDVKTGLELFYNDIKVLTGKGGPFEHIDVLIHLDHIQHDLDHEIAYSDLSRFSSIMYDASSLPLSENIRKTAEFVKAKGKEIFIEGACDEIVEATGDKHNDITKASSAKKYLEETGADIIVANLGTEHRATGKDLFYHGDAAREIKDLIGTRIVLHGTSSVTNKQVKNLFSDGICKVNIWTALERDSSPAIFEDMIKNAVLAAGPEKVEKLIGEGYLTPKCLTNEKISIAHFTSAHRNKIMFEEIKKMVTAYFEMWYN